MNGMHTTETLRSAWAASPAPPRGRGTVTRISIRRSKGVHERPPVLVLCPEHGVQGDRWAIDTPDKRDRQVSLMMSAVLALVAGDPPEDLPGDNVIVDLDLSHEALPVGSRLRLGSAVVEITAEPHLGCATFRERYGADALRWVNDLASRPARLRGVHSRIVQGGEVRVGDPVILIR